MKNKIINNIFYTCLGIISTLIITVSANILYNAKDIKYEPSDKSWSPSTVEEAIEELYKINGSFVIDYEYNGSGDAPTSFPNTPDGYSVTELKCKGADGTWDNKEWKISLTNFSGKKVSCHAILNDVQLGESYLFDYVGQGQSFIVPVNGTYKLEVWGAEGGRSYSTGHGWNNGGAGGYSVGNIKLDKGTKIYIYVGQRGAYEPTTLSYGFTPGGWNGGGNGGNRAANERGGSGGGATDISIYGDTTTDWNQENHLYSRVIVAGGGGGADGHTGTTNVIYGGAGGGSSGQGGLSGGDKQASTGGTQISGGSGANWSGYSGGNAGGFGYGGNITTQNAGSGGGAGWYGGGSATYAPGSGGSGFIYTSSTYNNWSKNSKEGNSGLWKINSNYYLSDAFTYVGTTSIPSVDGTTTETGHRGNGAAKITLISID